MSRSTSNNSTCNTTHSLLYAKRETHSIEREVLTLANRIRFLQEEESKIWKQIERTKKRTQDAEEKRKQSEERFRLNQAMQDAKITRIQDVRNNILLEKHKAIIQKEKRSKSFHDEKKLAYHKGRDFRDFSLTKRREYFQMAQYQNAKKSATIRQQVKEIQEKLSTHRKAKFDSSTEDYQRRLQEELDKTAKVEQKIQDLELVEIELIKRLKDTHDLSRQVFDEFEDAVSHRSNLHRVK
jgi:hypothetical protein